jgi:hypothetical protein
VFHSSCCFCYACPCCFCSLLQRVGVSFILHGTCSTRLVVFVTLAPAVIVLSFIVLVFPLSCGGRLRNLISIYNVAYIPYTICSNPDYNNEENRTYFDVARYFSSSIILETHIQTLLFINLNIRLLLWFRNLFYFYSNLYLEYFHTAHTGYEADKIYHYCTYTYIYNSFCKHACLMLPSFDDFFMTCILTIYIFCSNNT